MTPTPGIFLTDLDETLLTTDKHVSPATLATLQRLLAAGHHLCLASGRPFPSVCEVRNSLDLPDHNLWIIANNGASITSCESHSTIFEKRLPLDIVPKLLQSSWDEGVYAHTYTASAVLTREHSAELAWYLRSIHMPVEVDPDILAHVKEPPYKCLAISLKGRAVLEPLRQKLSALYPEYNFFQSAENLLEMAPPKVEKGAALVQLARQLNIPIERTLAAGDQANDISMLRAAGCAVAMLNGTPQVKAYANVITEQDNNHDGLVPVLTRFFQL